MLHCCCSGGGGGTPIGTCSCAGGLVTVTTSDITISVVIDGATGGTSTYTFTLVYDPSTSTFASPWSALPAAVFGTFGAQFTGPGGTYQTHYWRWTFGGSGGACQITVDYATTSTGGSPGSSTPVVCSPGSVFSCSGPPYTYTWNNTAAASGSCYFGYVSGVLTQ